MKDLPFFATQSGVASLILRQIPYTSEAYIRIHQTVDIKTLLKECCDFCRVVGAEKIYATGDIYLERYPFHTALLLMSCPRTFLVNTETKLVAITQEDCEEWRQIYNERMKNVHNAATMTTLDMNKMCTSGGVFFVYKDNNLIGIGAVKNNKITVVASVKPGNGANIVKALNGALDGEIAYVEVSSNNEKAVQLYEGLGFKKVNEITRWYRVK